MPTVVVATAPFADLARRVADALGLPEARIAVVEHPLGGTPERVVAERAAAAVDAVIALATTA